MPSLPAFPENNFYSGVAPAPNHLSEILQNIPGVIYELRQHPDGHFLLSYASEKGKSGD